MQLRLEPASRERGGWDAAGPAGALPLVPALCDWFVSQLWGSLAPQPGDFQGLRTYEPPPTSWARGQKHVC